MPPMGDAKPITSAQRHRFAGRSTAWHLRIQLWTTAGTPHPRRLGYRSRSFLYRLTVADTSSPSCIPGSGMAAERAGGLRARTRTNPSGTADLRGTSAGPDGSR